ncbi:sialate O-acetylesterase [Bacteroides sp.]
MKREIIAIGFTLLGLCGTFAEAKVKLPAFFSDGMVMQQQSDANLWGTATPGRTVTLTTGWDQKQYRTTADSRGNWKMSVVTPQAGGPYTLTFSDGEPTVLNNILIGELWICSGQSNMEMPMKGYKNQPVEGANMDILRSANPALRLFTVKRHSTLLPQYDVTGEWKEAAPASVREFSATAYYFGCLLNEILDVPVGLIVASWGGSAAEAWMTEDMLRAFPEAKIPRSEADITSKNRTPTALYNGMLHPLIGLTMRGVVWYQGEDNTNRPHSYADMFTTLINGWRAAWQQGDFPFYYCQIAPYDYALITEPGKEPVQSALIREAQSQVEHRVPNTGMAVLLDAGMEKGIHPGKKKVAGERLGVLALTKTYGIEGVNSESPYYKSMEVQGDTVIVSFERADMWIAGKECFESKLFSVAGEDRVFYPAKAWIVRSKMYVRSEKVPHPVAVRYAFDNYVEGDVFCDGLPLSSFRSDNW